MNNQEVTNYCYLNTIPIDNTPVGIGFGISIKNFKLK